MTEETLFHLALQRTDPVERSAFLEAACYGQSQLRAAVEALLAAHEAPGSLFDRPPAPLAPPADADAGKPPGVATGTYTPEPEETPPPLAATPGYPPHSETGLVIAGRYTLVEKLGEGGMGEVWVAQQTEPVKRQVALKLIKAGLDSRAVLGRFEAERQTLALMDHPHIAKVLDGGLTPAGQPFFVMEQVNGLPLTRFCDEARLTSRQRLELFVPICQAVQHAHHKGIVHRDLKPANILVTLLDGRPVPKVIDFGIAKATAGKLTDDSLATQFGAVVGTLEYMAPEQAGFSGEDIDTRADLYSLGVILYELLTGLRPFEAQRLRKAGLAEVVRILKEEEPPRPSTRLSSAESLPALAALRQTEPRKLLALLRGELDWVVMKCLEKQRDRRYETANALSRDVQRYLADEAVEARPPSAAYRLHKLLRGNKGPVVAASLVLLALLAGIVGTTLGLFEAQSQARRAHDEAAAAEAARDKEAKERGYAEAIAHFVKDDFLALTSVEGQGRFGGRGLTRNATLRELLDRAAEKLKDRKDLATRTEAELCWMIGVSYRGVGEFARAIPFLERSVELHRRASGPEAEATLSAQNSLAVVYNAAGQHGRAVSLHEETLKLTKAKRGPDHPLTLLSMNNLAGAYQAAGKGDLAVPLLEEALKLTKTKLGPDHPHTLITMNNLAGAYQYAGQLDLALSLSKETLKLLKAKLGPDHPDTLTSMRNLAEWYLAAAAHQAWCGQEKELAATCGHALELAKDSNDPITTERVAKACNLRPTGDASRLAASLLLARKAVERGKSHQALPWFQVALGMAEYRSGHLAEADAALSAAIAGGKGNAHITGTGAFYLAMSLFRQGKPDEARQLANAAAAKMKPLPKDEKNPLADNAGHNDLILWLAYKEAKALIGFDATPAAAPQKNAAAPRKKK
jgi:hypothetical protein